MRAVRFVSKNKVEFADIADPQPDAGDVVVAVKASGICHTDYEVLKDNYGTGAFPIVPGHEYAGVVVATGSAVTQVKEGDRVVVDPNLECGTCRACMRGWAHLCERLGAYGVTTHGGFAELSLVRAERVCPIGDLSYARAALAEPIGCVLNGLDAVHESWMKEVLIVGAGPMGLLMGLALRAEGTAEITFCDMSEDRLGLASSFGFKAIASGSEQMTTWHHRADLAVDATGVPAVAASLTSYMANGGKGLFFGVCPSDARIELSPFDMFRRQLTLAGSHSLNHNIPRSLALIDKIGPQIDKVVSHKVSLEAICEILASKPPTNSLKVQWSGK